MKIQSKPDSSFSREVLKTNQSSHRYIAQRIIHQLKKGSVPWRETPRPYWGFARNYVDDVAYTGINWVLLNLVARYYSPYFLTRTQVRDLGGAVTKNAVPEWGYSVVDDEVSSTKNYHERHRNYQIQRYEIFNSDDIAGIEFEPPIFPEDLAGSDWGGDAVITQICNRWDNQIFQEVGEGASELLGETIAHPFWDWSCLYNIELCHAVFNKLIHWTGHEQRLGRRAIIQSINPVSADFAEEHLIGEFGTAYLAMESGIDRVNYLCSTNEYRSKWINILQTDPRIVVRASEGAYKAIEYLFRVNV